MLASPVGPLLRPRLPTGNWRTIASWQYQRISNQGRRTVAVSYPFGRSPSGVTGKVGLGMYRHLCRTPWLDSTCSHCAALAAYGFQRSDPARCPRITLDPRWSPLLRNENSGMSRMVNVHQLLLVCHDMRLRLPILGIRNCGIGHWGITSTATGGRD